MDDYQAYREKARACGVPDPVISWIMQLARPRLLLSRDDGSGTGPVAGYLGGNPWLPEDVEWSGFPHFWASVDCAALPAGALDFPFPEDGHLLFFADADVPDFEPAGEDSYARVVYVPAGTATAERPPPDGDRAFMTERFPLRYELRWTLPDESSFEYQLLDEDSRNLFDAHDGGDLGSGPWASLGQLALGGHAMRVQDDPLLRFLPDDFDFPDVPIEPDLRKAQAAARVRDDLPLPSLSPPRPGATTPDTGGWLLLAEMQAKLGWGTLSGVTYWMIRRDDLADRRFDRVKHDAQIFE